MDRNINKKNFKFIASWPCLDFVNTRSWKTRDPLYERFNSYADMVRWGYQASLLTGEEAGGLYRQAEQQPAGAAAVFEQGLALRETIYQIFAPIAGGEKPDQAALVDLNRTLAAASPHLGVVQVGLKFGWGWLNGEEALDRPLWPVAHSAAELLVSGNVNKVGKCAGPSCGWLFLDLSRNHSRRWCAMNDCGNRAKASRHYYNQLTIRKK